MTPKAAERYNVYVTMFMNTRQREKKLGANWMKATPHHVDRLIAHMRSLRDQAKNLTSSLPEFKEYASFLDVAIEALQEDTIAVADWLDRVLNVLDITRRTDIKDRAEDEGIPWEDVLMACKVLNIDPSKSKWVSHE